MTRREKKYGFRFTLLGVGLFAVGVVVGFFVMRYPLEFLFNYGGNNFVLLPDADNYFSFVTFFLLAFGLVFELPLVLTFMAVVGLVSSQFLRAKRLYILFGLWLLSCFVTPGADPYSPLIIGISFTILFELSILLIRALGR
jgi:sec-independent protein translocase protein TatC